MISGPLESREWIVTDKGIVVGRDPTCEIRINDPYISRRHCEILLRGDDVWIYDLNSQNATLVNGVPTKSARLAPGDTINFPMATLAIAVAGHSVETAPGATSPTASLDESVKLDGCEAPGLTLAKRLDPALLNALDGLARNVSADRILETVENHARGILPSADISAGWIDPARSGDGKVRLREGTERLDAAQKSMIRQSVNQMSARLLLSRSTDAARIHLCTPLPDEQARTWFLLLERSIRGGPFTQSEIGSLVAVAETLMHWRRSRARIDPHTISHAAAAKAVPSLTGTNRLLGQSKAVQSLREALRVSAQGRSSVLLSGESGVGKELAARALHELGSRAAGPYVVVNCAAIPSDLFESEFFGHVAGAYTGAVRARLGLVREADGGTLFLDEVGDLSPRNQARMLRVVETGTVRPVGADKEIPVDVRFISASNRPLTERGTGFRLDLYYRLAAIRIDVPPLREREADAMLLAESFVATLTRTWPARPLGFAPEARDAILRYPWPGNVRELQNVIEHACQRSPNRTITIDDLALNVYSTDVIPDVRSIAADKQQMLLVLERCRGDISAACDMLGIAKSTLYYRLAKLGIPTPHRQRRFRT